MLCDVARARPFMARMSAFNRLPRNRQRDLLHLVLRLPCAADAGTLVELPGVSCGLPAVSSYLLLGCLSASPVHL
jgi:hypothetical protein